MISQNILDNLKIPINSTVSFDFDGTLDDDFDGTPNNQKKDIQAICSELIKRGNKVYIITKRYGPNHKNKGIGNEHLVVYNLAPKIGVNLNNIYFTNREFKYSIIKNMGIDYHFENSEYECKLINQTSNTNVIWIEDPYWKDLIF